MKKIISVMLVALFLCSCFGKSKSSTEYDGAYAQEIKAINELARKAKLTKLELEDEYLIFTLWHNARSIVSLALNGVNKEKASGFSLQCVWRGVTADRLTESVDIALMSEILNEITDGQWDGTELRDFLTENVDYDLDGEYAVGDELVYTREVKTKETDDLRYELYFSPIERETYLEVKGTAIKDQTSISYTARVANFLESHNFKEWQRYSLLIFSAKPTPDQAYEIILRIRLGTKVTLKNQEQSHSYIILSFLGNEVDEELFTNIVEVLNPEPVDKVAIKDFVKESRAEYETKYDTGISYLNKYKSLSSAPYIEIFFIIDGNKKENLGYQYVISPYR